MSLYARKSRRRMSPSTIAIGALAVVAVLCLPSGAATAGAGKQQSPSWREVKCARYKTAWSAALARQGRHGLGRAFLGRHEAFLTSNCTAKADVCPRSPEEFKLANILVVLAMNAGAASTFPPFACRD